MKLKTRTNQPVYYELPVSSNMEQLSDDLLNSLKVGDVVQKKTGKQKHCYVVTYKGDGAGEGICLTYVACGYMETISYDRSGSSWVFNSKDVCEVPSGSDVKALAKEEVEDAPSGTIQDALGLNSSGELVKGSVSGGTQLYRHNIHFSTNDNIYIYSTDNTQISSVVGVNDAINSANCLCVKIYSGTLSGNLFLTFGVSGMGVYRLSSIDSSLTLKYVDISYSSQVTDGVTPL